MPQLMEVVLDKLEKYRAFAASQKFNYQPHTLYDPVRYAMATKGKAVRPSLLMLSHYLGSDELSEALPAAYALELFHNFTLLHDDIMDEAPLRRGQPSVHIKYGEPTAILAGDAMLIHTYGYLIEHYEGKLQSQLLKVFQAMAIALCSGQQLDMDMEQGYEASYADYLEMIKGKTGVLITAAMEMGALIAKLPPEDIQRVKQAGDLAGRAFQIQDDVLDTFATSEQTGKDSYGDIRRGKQSAPYIKALDLASPEQAKKLKDWYAGEEHIRIKHVHDILAIYKDLAVEKILGTAVDELSEQAKNCISALSVPRERTVPLLQLLAKLARRSF